MIAELVKNLVFVKCWLPHKPSVFCEKVYSSNLGLKIEIIIKNRIHTIQKIYKSGVTISIRSV